MSAQVSILVEYIDGKPSTAIGARAETAAKTRAYTRKGDAENYRAATVAEAEYWRQFYDYLKSRDIRILTITIPDEGPVGEGMWPELLPEIAVAWS